MLKLMMKSRKIKKNKKKEKEKPNRKKSKMYQNHLKRKPKPMIKNKPNLKLINLRLINPKLISLKQIKLNRKNQKLTKKQINQKLKRGRKRLRSPKFNSND